MKRNIFSALLLAMLMALILTSCSLIGSGNASTEETEATVILNPKGGTVKEGNIYIAEKGKEYTLPTPEKAGYTFEGWYINENYVPSSGESWTLGKVTLIAKWEIKKISVTLDAVGGTLSSGSSYTAYEVEKYVLPVPEKNGYVFEGWYNGETLVPSSGASWTLGAIKLTAKWTLKEANITLDADGGVLEGGDKYIANEVDEYTLPTPVKAGYSFEGWYNGKTLVASSGASWTLGDVTLTAKWKIKKINVTLDAGGGALELGNSYIAYEIREYSLPTPTKEGYVFEGWYNEDTLVPMTGEAWTLGTVTLTAKWKLKEINVTLDPDGGTLADGTAYVAYEIREYSLPTPEKAGFVFAGWYNGDTLLPSSGEAWSFGEVTLTAKWTVAINLTLNPNGGTLTGGTAYVVYEDAEYSLPTPEKAGFVFVGWYSGDTLIPSSGEAWSFGEVTLTAKWTVTVNLTLDPDGGVLEGGNSYVVYEGIEYTLPTPTKDGYAFAGWYNGDTLVPTSGAAWTSDEITALTAKWVKASLVYLDAKNGSSLMTVTMGIGESYELPSPKSGSLIFGGWYDEEGNLVLSEGTWTTEESVTLYAKWLTETGKSSDFENGQPSNVTLSGPVNIADGKVNYPGSDSGLYGYTTFYFNNDTSAVTGLTDGVDKLVFGFDFTYNGGALTGQEIAFIGFLNAKGNNEQMYFCDYIKSSATEGTNGADSLTVYGYTMEMGKTYTIRIEQTMGNTEECRNIAVYINGALAGYKRAELNYSSNDYTQVLGYAIGCRGASATAGCDMTVDNVFVGVAKEAKISGVSNNFNNNEASSTVVTSGTSADYSGGTLTYGNTSGTTAFYIDENKGLVEGLVAGVDKYVFEFDFTYNGGALAYDAAKGSIAYIGFLNANIGNVASGNMRWGDAINSSEEADENGALSLTMYGQTFERGKTYRVRIEQTAGTPEAYRYVAVYINGIFVANVKQGMYGNYAVADATKVWGYGLQFRSGAAEGCSITFDNVFCAVVK